MDSFFSLNPMGLRGSAGIIPMSHPWGCVAPNVFNEERLRSAM